MSTRPIGPRTRRRLGVLVASLGILATMAPAMLASPAAAADPQQVSFTLEGCRNDGSIVLPIGGQFICPNAAYTTGNLGKGWNELDLVPFRLTSSAGNSAPASQTFTVAVVLDNFDAGHPGYDVLSVPTLNAGLSASSCTAPTVGPQQSLTPGLGGIATSIYRLVTITQATHTDCVYDYYGRLALGSHLFPGSSLHANLANENLGTAGIGSKDVSIPVKEILPQELRKDMTATQDSDHVWSISKQATPANLSFTDTCAVGAAMSKAVQVTVQWQRLPAAGTGNITIVTHVYAKNPASRVITVNVSDDIRSGTTILDTAAVSNVDVPANTELLVLTHTTSVPDGKTNLNDVATATYTDKVTGIPVPGNTTATASATVQPSGVELNKTATITDVESLTGANLEFSVDSVTGSTSGSSFGGGYTPGTHTTGPVSWTSGTQSGSGSVTFNKTVYVTQPSITSGTLSDTATLTGSDGFTTSASASTNLSATAAVSLKIDKTMSLSFASAKTFTFHVLLNGTTEVAVKQITIPAGSTAGSVTATGLAPGTYTVHEDATAPFGAQDSAPVTITLPSCSNTLTVTNNAAPAGARVRKITLPAGSTSWAFTLTGKDAGNTDLGISEVQNATAGAGYVSFATALDVDGATYTITETAQSGWDLTGVAGDFNGNAGRAATSTASRTCSVTLNLTTDSGGLMSCTFTNTQRGSIIVKKVTEPAGAPGSFTFTGDAAGSIGDGGSITVSNLVPGNYSSTEADPTPNFDLKSVVCDDSNSSGSVATRTASFVLDPGETVTCTFTNTQRGTVKVVKTHDGLPPSGTDAFVFELRSGASTGSAGTILETQTANAGNGGVLNFATKLVPGATYAICEQVLAGWENNFSSSYTVYNPSGDNSVVCSDFTVSPGEQKVFTVDNHRPGGRALTIGFWKNWASCSSSNGKQKPVLDQTLALADQSGGITLGLLTLHASDCAKAVAILNKSDIVTGKKMASDPANNMAAQLLAAKLNVVAGAGLCPAATQAIADGSALLTAIGFTGTGKYANTMTSAQIAQANSLAATLDAYNNNLLC
ncbi:MAG TPA: hypothetical protein VFJ85_01690 [Acidimicrobiales bacterium]|nr:hypothetical protein [Acidimicrobiales bacterium]